MLGTGDLLGLLSDAVMRQSSPRVLVAIDGPDAAGKTTLADALAKPLLDPFSAGEREVVVRTFDHRSETPAGSGRVSVEDRCVLVFDGVFLLRPELGAHWDLSVTSTFRPR